MHCALILSREVWEGASGQGWLKKRKGRIREKDKSSKAALKEKRENRLMHALR